MTPFGNLVFRLDRSAVTWQICLANLGRTAGGRADKVTNSNERISMKIRKLIFPILLMVNLLGVSFAAETTISPRETTWQKRRAFKIVIDQMNDNRFMPYQLFGKFEHGEIFYKGNFMPFPPTMEEYRVYFGMNTKSYHARKNEYESVGYQEIWHQSYNDAAGSEVHQAIWLKMDGAMPETPLGQPPSAPTEPSREEKLGS